MVFPAWYRTFSVTAVLSVVVVGCGAPSRPVEEITTALEQVDFAVPITVDEHDWPWWRGPAGDNVAACETAPTKWSESENIVWKCKVSGRGHGSPTVVG
ncbi:MAG: hypothetical protein GY826_28215, partial [Fuerstiella sp.]|nr:hypothetical protein [Fuerstiella sp.]